MNCPLGLTRSMRPRLMRRIVDHAGTVYGRRVRPMTPAPAADVLDELREVTVQIRAVAVFDPAGEPLASADLSPRQETGAAGVRRLVEGGMELWRIAMQLAGDSLAQTEISTAKGSVFLVNHDGRLIAATTGRDPASGLVLYDLRRALEQLAAAEPAG
jgi:predicted regulator of Ras-like GTPase activity (Roadblock/LC7/MglB family)